MVQKLILQKSTIFSKICELCQTFIQNFIYKNVEIFPLYIYLIRKIETFWSEKIATVPSGSIIQEKSAIFSKIFELYKLFMRDFLYQKVFDIPIINIASKKI